MVIITFRSSVFVYQIYIEFSFKNIMHEIEKEKGNCLNVHSFKVNVN